MSSLVTGCTMSGTGEPLASENSPQAIAPAPKSLPEGLDTGEQPTEPRSETPAGASDSTTPPESRRRIASLNDPTPFGVSGNELLAHLTGEYRGAWDSPIGDFTFALEPAGDDRVEIVELNAALPKTPDNDGDGVRDGSVELRIAVNCSLTAADGRLRVEQARSQIKTTSAVSIGTGAAVSFADLDPRLIRELFGTLPAGCDSMVFGMAWKAPSAYDVTLAVFDSKRTNCVLYSTPRITRTQ